tara:strand:- start:7342 stop:8343 length:1002 start_codon:yes stop_codon:yes gene_type:complete
MKPVVVDLFCGMGGFSEGAKLAGFDVVLAIDNWAEGLKVHASNHKNTRHENITFNDGGKGSIQSVSKLIRSVVNGRPFHLHGSPPCQELSKANPKGDPLKGLILVNWFLDLVKELNPDSWSMEQVRTVSKYLPKSINYQILNATDFGVPQTRERCYAGFGWAVNGNEKPISVIEALPYLKKEATRLRGYKTANPVLIAGRHSHNEKASDLQVSRELNKPSYTLGVKPLILMIESTGANSNRGADKPITKPSPTLCLGSNQVGPRLFNGLKKVRSLTIEECLIIQGFSSDYEMGSTRLKKDKFTMIGNAVNPPISASILNGLLKPIEMLSYWVD